MSGRLRSWLDDVAFDRAWTMRLFSVGLGLTYVCAFISIGVQIDALYGPDGIQPAPRYMEQLGSYLRGGGFWAWPTLFWWDSSPAFLKTLAGVGCVAAIAFALGFLPAVSAFVAWLCYLSFLNGGSLFMSFQWDILLVETGFLAIWLYPFGWRASRPRAVAVLLLWWLNFRLMYASGAVKLLSGDPAWRDWTAMLYHFETTCLPNPLSWFAHNAPDFMLRALTGFTFFVELFVPWLIVLGRSWRMFAGLAFILTMLGIAATGNYTFFNLLSAVLALTLFDDRFLGRPSPTRTVRHTISILPAAVAASLFVMSLVPLARVLPYTPPTLSAWLYGKVERFRLVNGYGLFATMTKQRPELIVEGSLDGETWRAYRLKYKPHELDRLPPQVAPHQPRVDWQMWFAALGDPRRNGWVFAMLDRLCTGSPDVLGLFEDNPFPDAYPQQLRATLYDYRMSTPEERASSGHWWKRSYVQPYGPPVYCVR